MLLITDTTQSPYSSPISNVADSQKWILSFSLFTLGRAWSTVVGVMTISSSQLPSPRLFMSLKSSAQIAADWWSSSTILEKLYYTHADGIL